MSPKQSDAMAYAEEVWDQIKRANICSGSNMAQARIKNSLRAFTFNILKLDDKRIFKDRAKLKSVRQLREKTVLLK